MPIGGIEQMCVTSTPGCKLKDGYLLQQKPNTAVKLKRGPLRQASYIEISRKTKVKYCIPDILKRIFNNSRRPIAFFYTYIINLKAHRVDELANLTKGE